MYVDLSNMYSGFSDRLRQLTFCIAYEQLQNKDFKGMPRILEVNPNHSLMGHMSKILKSNPKEFDDLSKIVLDHARLLEGHLPSDVSFYCKKINELITAKA